MELRWYELLNPQGDVILYNNKPILFQHSVLNTKCTSYSDEEIQSMPGNSSFKKGWMEKEYFYLVNMEGLTSKCLIEYIRGS